MASNRCPPEARRSPTSGSTSFAREAASDLPPSAGALPWRRPEFQGQLQPDGSRIEVCIACLKFGGKCSVTPCSGLYIFSQVTHSLLSQTRLRQSSLGLNQYIVGPVLSVPAGR